MKPNSDLGFTMSDTVNIIQVIIIKDMALATSHYWLSNHLSVMKNGKFGFLQTEDKTWVVIFL